MVEWAQNNTADILILDIRLEHGDHLDIATYLVDLKPCSKIILISGFTRGYKIPTSLKDNSLKYLIEYCFPVAMTKSSGSGCCNINHIHFT